jgi:hypothetical protein
MGYWYCKARIKETIRQTKEVRGFFGTKMEAVETESYRIVSGKVFGFTNHNDYNSDILVVAKEGKNPVIEEVSQSWDEILELRWVGK